MARRKISEEKARIEDEAAAALDTSKVYDIHTLLPRRDIFLDQARRVKARDCFTMRLYHSSDENIERTIELILRDPSSRSKYSEGEVLFAELGENSTKWLLFAPVPLSAISARTGDAAGEIVVMVRGLDQEAQEWTEVMALASSTAAGFEWVQMLGLIPIPPEGPFSKEPMQPAILETVIEESIAPSRHYPPIQPRRRKSRHAPKANVNVSKVVEPVAKDSNDDGSPEEPDVDQHTADTPAEAPTEEVPVEPEPTPMFSLPPGWLPPDFSAALVDYPVEHVFLGGDFEVADITFQPEKPPSRDGASLRSPSLHTLTDAGGSSSPRTKSAASIQRSRRASRPHSRKSIGGQSASSATEDFQEQEQQLPRSRSVHQDDEERPNPNQVEPSTPRRSITNPMDNVPDLQPPESSGVGREPDGDSPPPVPPHRTPTNAKQGNSSPAPVSAASPAAGFGGRRRTSSPLKHEYDPSSPSDSGSERMEDQQRVGDDRSYSSSSSSSSEDEESDDAVSLCSEEEDGDYPPPLLSIPRRLSRQPSVVLPNPQQRPSSISSSSATIENADVENASEATAVPPTPVASPPQHPPPPVPKIGSKFRAFIFTWATNQWEKISPGECLIIITPGHIESFPLASSGTGGGGDKAATPLGPLDSLRIQGESIFSFDLTASLPVRRGTAVDVSVKTPSSSKLAGASIMLRSRSPSGCEGLYNTINANRIYPQNQLPPTTTVSSISLPSEMGNSESSASIKRGFGAWARSKSYRAGASASTPSLVSSPSETSVNSVSSAFSRFRPGRIFKNSPLSSAASSSSSMGDSSRGGTPPGLPNVPGIENGVVQMAPMKIRLYRRENPSKWRDLGNARLNVLKPNEGQRGRSMHEDDKRIVIVNKKGDMVLLDVVLGESAFERVARTGIAVSILVGEGEADGSGKPGDVGGIGAKSTVYMMQVRYSIPTDRSCVLILSTYR